MNVGYIVAAVCAVVGLILIWYRSSIGKQLGVMASMTTSNAADVGKLSAGTQVEVKGTLACASPLTSPFAKKPAAYYKAVTDREVEHERRGSDGKMHRERKWEEAENDVQSAACQIKDASGSVSIDFTGADVEAPQVHDEKTRERMSLGKVGGDMLNSMLGQGSTIGWRHREWVLAPGASVYVLASVVSGGGVGKGGTFVVTHKSKEERTQGLTQKQLYVLLGAVGLFIAAAVAAYFGWKSAADAAAAAAAGL